MIRLLTNEIIKLRKTKLFYILSGLVVISAMLLTLSGLLVDDDPSSFNGDDWKNNVTQEVDKLNDKNSKLEDKNDLNFSEELDVELNNEQINRLEYHLDHGIAPPTQSSLYNNLKSSTILVSLIAVLGILVSSNMIPKEFEFGTIKNLVSSPHSRIKLLLSKYITVIGFNLFLLFLMYIAVAAVSLMFFDIDQSKYLVINDASSYTHVTFWIFFLKTVLFKFVYLAVVSTFAFVISIILKNSSLSVMITLSIIFLSKPLMSFLSDKTDLVKYSITENWDLTKYLAGNSGPMNTSLAFSSAIIGIYVLLIIALGFMYFRKSDIK